MNDFSDSRISWYLEKYGRIEDEELRAEFLAACGISEHDVRRWRVQRAREAAACARAVPSEPQEPLVLVRRRVVRRLRRTGRHPASTAPPGRPNPPAVRVQERGTIVKCSISICLDGRTEISLEITLGRGK